MYKLLFLCLFVISSYGCGAPGKTADTSARIHLDVIPLELTTHLGDQQQFIEGDEIQFLLSLGEDAYIYMYYIDATGKITQILPNPNQHSHLYSAGYFMTIPEYENLYRFTISEPFGEESIWVIASDQSISLQQPVDSIETIKNIIMRSSKRAYGEYVLSITTRK